MAFAARDYYQHLLLPLRLLRLAAVALMREHIR
jgi:hypothetical protein